MTFYETVRMTISKINFFQPDIWEKGALRKELGDNLATPDTLYAYGRCRSAFDQYSCRLYKKTLKGLSIEKYDPNGFLGELDLHEPLTPGRTNIEMVRAFHFVKEYRPDPRYFPLPPKVAPYIQTLLLAISRISIRLISIIDRMVNPVVVKRIKEKINEDPYGRNDEKEKGDRSDLSKETRYLCILRNRIPQYTWGRGPHIGSIVPEGKETENLGTYDIALKLGFTEMQAVRIAKKCYDVDINKTIYHDPNDRTKPRQTGSIGATGDIHRHYNLSASGVEDTRIAAAKIHLNRALCLADERYYDAAEQELSIGLHSLQDIFSHAQISPMVHTLIGEFPDIVQYHPLSMFETALATEGYLKKFIDGLNLQPFNNPHSMKPPVTNSDPLIIGDVSLEEKSVVSKKMAEFPTEMTAYLTKNGISIFIGKEGTKLTDLGFGMDLDGDGKITPGHWVHVNRDGRKQWFEVEDQFAEQKTWNRQHAAYNHQKRMIFILCRVLKNPDFEEILKHEINHAIDLILSDDPQLGSKWVVYIKKLYNSARRRGEIAFDELDPHEYFAISDSTSV